MIETLLPFIGVVFVLMIMPGTDMAIIVASGAAYGRRGAFFSTLGVVVGGGVWILATAALVAGVTAINPRLLEVVQGLGCAYLLYMAFAVIRHKASTTEAVVPPRRRELFFRGFVTNLSNPKCLVFFPTFLPQFIPETATNPGLYVLLLGLILEVIGFCMNFTFGLTGAMLHGLDRVAFAGRSWSQWIISVMFAAISIVFAYQLAWVQG